MKLGITTVRKPDDYVISLAKTKSEKWEIPYFEREGLLLEMAGKNDREGFLIYGHQPPSFWVKENIYKFHLGTSVLRIRQIQAGKRTDFVIFFHLIARMYWIVLLGMEEILQYSLFI